MLVDSGVNTDKNAVPDFLREKGVEEIEYAVFTHPHADHIGAAAEVVRGFRVKNVYMPDVAHTSKTYLDLLDALEADESVSVRRAVAGESFSIGEVTFDILSPIEDKYSDLNLYSAVLRVTYREKRFLLMGDAEQPNETALLASGESLRADLLKVGHHGSSTSSSADFLRAVRPDCALISCGEGNSYGHPEQVVLDRLEAIGAAVYRTDRDGTIRAVCDGKTIEITTERTS
ncbi:MAG: ComEC/Rec2 family competence protein [Acutalibacteraceae bacterium]